MKWLDPEIVLGAYAVGVFPMADHRNAETVYWVEPKRRAVLPLDGFRLSHSLRKVLAQDRYRVTADQAFGDVLALCGEAAPDRPETWINSSIAEVFGRLHDMGFAHSIECWDGDDLVGGLYGLALGRAFFGESMVSRARDASKVALAWLVARLRAGGFTLLDCQFQTDHLASLGAVEISRADYLGLLSAALSGLGDAAAAGGGAVPLSALAAPSLADFFALDRVGAASLADSAPVNGKLIAQLLVQTS
ncbi:leucyl/phenylalanyl-tRNA--protein transferase [Sphingomonas sp. GlSt437]|uniref:leucyl/phenylalanyl-tRNA--protein transferase n=1 Tax=Sphingomonas sp. GlSt437 TaxID=3389970 RepID=UPI003A86A63C